MALYEETRDLQEERNLKFPDVGVPQKSFVEAFAEKAHLFKNFDYEAAPTLDTTPIEITRPRSWERKLGRFYDPTIDHENLLAEQQSSMARVGAFLPRVAIKAASEVAQLPGYLGGAIAWGLHGFDANEIGLMVDNAYQQKVKEIEEGGKDLFPVFASDKVKYGNIWDNVFSTAFWANEGADGLGFMLAFLAPGFALRSLKTGAKIARMIKPGTSMYSTLKASADATKAGKALATTNMADRIEDVTSTMINTLFESAAEAGETFQNVLDKTEDRNLAGEAAVDVMKKNFGILAASNYLDQKWLFGKVGLLGKNADMAAKELTEKGIFKRIMKDGDLLDQVTKRTRWENIGAGAKAMLAGIAKEGFWEEGMQFAASKRVEEGVPEDDNFIGGIIDVVKTWAENLSDTEMQKSILLGSVLGTVVPGIGQVRQARAEDKFLSNLHKHMKENFVDRYRTFEDIVKIDQDGNKIIGKNGKYELDMDKAKEMLRSSIIKTVETEQLLYAARTGNKELFEKIKNQRDFNYFLPFIQNEGGLTALLTHIDKLAEHDIAAMEEEGILGLDVNQIKKELKDKARLFQDIYDRVESTHDVNFNIKYDKKDQETYDNFKDLIKHRKLGEEVKLKHATNRVDKLIRDLASYKSGERSVPITSPETTYSDKLVSDLKNSLAENKTNMSETDVTRAEQIILNIEGHIADIEKAIGEIKGLYDNSSLQNDFNDVVEKKKKATAQTNQNASDAVKEKESEDVNPVFQDLYKKATAYNTTPEGGMEKVSGDIVIEVDNEDETISRYTLTDLEIDEDGGLLATISGHEMKDKTGKLTNPEITNNIGKLNIDGTFSIGSQVFKVLGDPVVTRDGDTVLNDLKKERQAKPQTKPKEGTGSFEKVEDNKGEDFEEEEDFKPEIHQFSETAGVLNWLKTSGSQEQVALYNNEPLGRWHYFVNNHLFKLIVDGKSNIDYRSFSYAQVGRLPLDDEVRTGIKFFIGYDNKVPQYKTYDEIEQLPDTAKKAAYENCLDDIRLVVYQNNKPFKVDKNGELTKGERTFLVYNAFGKPILKRSSGYPVFGLDKARRTWRKANGIEKAELTAEQEKSFRAYINPKMEASRKEYAAFRDRMKREQVIFDFSSTNPGHKVNDENAQALFVDVLDATGYNLDELRKNINIEAVEVDKKVGNKTRLNVSGYTYGVKNGYVYVGYMHKYEPITIKKLKDTGNSVQEMTNLIRYYYSTKSAAERREIKKFIETALFLTEDAPYNIRIKSNQIEFGKNTLSGVAIANGEGIDLLSKFLEDKKWNISKASLLMPEFVEIFVVPNDKSETGFDLMQARWTRERGGYLGYLFSSVEEEGRTNVSKGTLFIRPKAKTPMEQVKNPQFINQSINLIPRGYEAENVTTPVNNKNTQVPKKKAAKSTFAQDIAKTQETKTTEKPEGAKLPTAKKKAAKSTFSQDVTKTQRPVPGTPEPNGLGDTTTTETKPPVTTTKPPTTITEEEWNNLGVAKMNFINKAKKENPTLSQEEILKIAKAKASDFINGLNRDVPYLEDSILMDQYERENIEAAVSWLSSKFPKLPIEVVEGLINGKSFGTFTKHSKILLSSIAEIGTGYHEGFHAFSQLVLSNQSRKELYDETRKRLGNVDLTDKQAEEILAEEFRSFMMIPTGYRFGKNEENKKSWFNKLLDIILEFFGIGDKNNIEIAFDVLKNYSFEIEPREFAEDKNRDVIGNLSEKETVRLVKHMSHQFFHALFDPNGVFGDNILFNTNQSFDALYDALKVPYERKAKEGSVTAQRIVDNYDKIIDEHSRFLKNYRIKINQVIDDLEIDESDMDDRSAYTYMESLSINMSDLVDNNIRLLIAGLPSVVRDDSRINETLTEYEDRSVTRFAQTLNTLNNELSNLGNDPKEYFDKIRQLATKQPEFNVLLKRLRVDEEITDPNILSLQTGFVKAFGHYKTIPILNRFNRDGTKYFHSGLENATERQIKDDWENTRVEIADMDDSYIYTDDRGAYMLDINRLKKDIETANGLNTQYRDQINAYLNILSGIGIRFAVPNNDIRDPRDIKTIEKYMKYLFNQLGVRIRKDIPAQDLFNSRIVRNQKEVASLIQMARKHFVNKTTLMYFNHEGNKQYPITLYSHSTKIPTLLNKIEVVDGELVIPEEVDYLKPYDGKTGNLFSTNSMWWSEITAGNKLENVLLSGITDPSKNGVDIHKAKFGDYKATIANAILQGYFPHIRSAERKLETVFRIMNPDGTQVPVNYSVSREIFKKDMTRYLEDELVTSFALLLDPANWGGDINNYRDNAKKLRVFDFLYDENMNNIEEMPPQLEDFKNATNTDGRKNTVNRARTLKDIYLNNYSEYIDKAFDAYIDKLLTLTEQSFLEDNVVSIERFKGKERIAVRGLDIDVLSNFGIDLKSKPNGMITKEEFNKINLFLNYRNFIGNNEQLKLILGDLAMFKDMVDFHKRVTGSTSTKYTVADSPKIRATMNKLYPRLDEKKYEETINMIVANDIISSNEDLKKNYFSEYGEMKGTDAISYATLDGMRDIMIRHNMWGEDQEKTYQYEMQTLAIEVLKRQKEGKTYAFVFSTDMFEKEDGIFYKHTGGIVPEKPMYNKKELAEEELGIISMQKPQGFGRITNVTGLNATQYWKTATSTMFPRIALRNEDSLSILLEMMSNKIDILAFDSSMKVAKTSSEKYSLDENNNLKLFDSEKSVSIQKMNFSDFGFQLDIHEETSGRVTQSTQRTKLEPVNLFSKGIFVKKDQELKKLSDEYDTLTNRIVVSRRDKLFQDDLALTITNNGVTYELKEENREQFENAMINIIESRLLPKNVINGFRIALRLDPELGYNEKVFDVTPNAFDIQGVLMSLVRNNIISRKLPGVMAVQEPSFLYEKGSDYLNNNRQLKFYRLESGKVQPMQVMMALPLNLLEFTKSIGGLDALNTAIKAKDTKVLGKDFLKFLYVPMNRIPGQKLSSLDIAEVVEFLPHYHGPKVVLPPEITIKAGSDFDVDKMASYFKHVRYDKKEKGIIYDDDIDTLEGMENRLMEIMKDMTLHEERFKELLEPTDTKLLKDISTKVRKKISHTTVENAVLSAKISDVVSLWYNNQKAYEFWKSKRGTGPAAVFNTLQAFMQKHPIEMNTIVPLFFKGNEINIYNNGFTQEKYGEAENEDEQEYVFTTNEKYSSGFLLDSENNSISTNLSEFISAFIDAIKDPFIFEFASSDNFNTIAMMNMFGRNSGIGIETIANFISQDSIVNFERDRRKNSPKFMKNNYYSTAPNKDLQDYMGVLSYGDQVTESLENIQTRKYPKENPDSFPRMYVDTVAYIMGKFLSESDPYLKNEHMVEIKKRIRKYNYERRDSKGKEHYFSLEDLSGDNVSNTHDQVQILDMYLTYKTIANHMFTLGSVIRADAKNGISGHVASTESNAMQSMDSLTKGGLFYIPSIVSAIQGTEENPSMIAKFYDTKENINNYLGWTSIVHKDPVISNFFQNEIYPTFGVPSYNNTTKDIEKVYKTIESDLFTFIIMRSIQVDNNWTDDQLEEYYKDLMMGNNSVARELLDIKSQILGNEGINNLYPSIATRNQVTRTLSEIDNIIMYDKTSDPMSIDIMEQDLYELGITTNPSFIDRLMMHSLLQSGYTITPDSYMHIIPSRLFTKRSKKAIRDFLELDDITKKESLGIFLNQMYRNNVSNSKIVPLLLYPFDYNRNFDYNNKSNSYEGKNYLAARYYTRDPVQYYQIGEKPPMDIMLLERSGETTFRIRVPKLGGQFKEFYPLDKLRKGITKSSKYIKLPVDVEYTPAEQETLDEKIENHLPVNEDIEEAAPDIIDKNDPLITQKQEQEDRMMTDVDPHAFNPKLLRKGHITEIPPTETNSFVAYAKKTSTINLEEYNIISTSLQKMLKIIATTSMNPARRELAKALDKALPHPVKLQFEKDYFELNRDEDGDLRSYGLFQPPEGFLRLDISYKDWINKSHIKIYTQMDDASTEESILHEALHALSHKSLISDEQFRNDTKRLMEHVKIYMANSEEYKELLNKPLWEEVLKTPSEFISWGLTNVRVQSILANIPAQNPVETAEKINKDSALTDFLNNLTNVLRKYFNMIFRGTGEEYEASVDNMRSALSDLILTTDESLIEKSVDVETGQQPIVVEFVEEENADRSRMINIKEKNKEELSKEPEVTESTVYNKQQVIDSLLDAVHESMRDDMRNELARMDKDEFETYAKSAGFNSLGKYWTPASVANITEIERFNKLYPQYNYFNSVEREAYQDAVNKGGIELACGL